MTSITIAKRTDAELTEQQRDVMRTFLFDHLDGLSDTDKKAWKRVWRHIVNMGSGELLSLDIVFPRNSKYHRRFFVLLSVGFDAWEPGRKRKTYKGHPVEKNFEQFREEVTILAGYYEQTFDLRGRMQLKAKSISFAKMEQPEFEALYGAVAQVLLSHVLTNYTDRAQLDAVVERMIGLL